VSVIRHNAWTYATGERISLLRKMSLSVQALDNWISLGWESLTFDPAVVFFNTWNPIWSFHNLGNQATQSQPRWQQQNQLSDWLATCEHKTALWYHDESPTFFVVFENDNDAMLFLLTWGDM
jgi:hypothetical protein